MARYFWLIALAVSAFSYIAATRAAGSLAADDPRATSEAKSLRFWFQVISAAPWLVMGVGIIFGGVPNFWSYFRPQDGNPYVLAWYGLTFLLTLHCAWWVFFQGGAEKVVRLQPFTQKSTVGTMTTGRVKIMAALGPFWFGLWVLIVVAMDARI